MPYRKVELRKDNYYHVYNRGINREAIFFDRDNYLFLLKRLREKVTTDGADLVCYCLMPNHYHFLLYIKVDDFGRYMQPFLLSYTKAVNRRRDRVGPLFQGRFQAVHVDREEYLLYLTRYIHLNPVRAGLVKRPEEWEFSSYQEFIGLRGGTLPRPEIILSQFPSPEAYRCFVEAGLAEDDALIGHLTFD